MLAALLMLRVISERTNVRPLGTVDTTDMEFSELVTMGKFSALHSIVSR